jgi:hypothetical protein
MIKKFDDFFDKSNQMVVESSAQVAESEYEDIENGIAFDDEDLKEAEDFQAPRMVADNKYLSKISMIVVKHLRKRVSAPFMVYPFVLTINGKDCSMIQSQTSSLVLFKDGVEKTIAYFKGNPLKEPGIKSDFAVSTRKLGFLAMIRSLVDFVATQFEGDGKVNEARSTPEITPATKPSYAAYVQICKKLNDTTAIPKDAMYEFLKYYEKYEDAEIKSMLCSDPSDLPEALQIVQKSLATKKDGVTIDATAAYRSVQVAHMVLCGVTYGCDDKEAKALRDVWFWGGGKSGKLAIEFSASGGYVVKEAEDVMDSRVDELQRKMDSVYRAAEGVCKYIKSGGKDMSMRGEIAKHRGILITGVAGIGKTVALNQAIRDTHLIENVDYKKMGNATTGAREVYHELYEGNNMLLIYDDTPDMFDTPSKVSLWKLAMEGDEANRMVMSPDGEAKKSSRIFYNASDPDMTRQDRYFREIGRFTPYEKDEWIKKESKKIASEYKSRKGGEDSPLTAEGIKIMATKRFKEYEDNEAVSLIPDRFLFNGIIVYISNQTLSTFRKSVKDHWDAISSRMEMIDISPTRKVVWAWLRKKIMADAADAAKPDDLRILPIESGIKIDDVVSHIDDIMEGKFNDESNVYGKINFRIISNIREYIMFGNPEWKQKILDNMLLNSERES